MNNKNAADNRLLSKLGMIGTPAAKKNIHVKILVTGTLSVVLSIILLTVILYIYFENVIIGKIYTSEKNNLFQAGVSTRLMQELSKSIAVQMYNDFTLSGLFFSGGNDPLETYNALLNLKKYKDLIPYVHSIYVYNPIIDTYFVNSPAKTSMVQKALDFFDRDNMATVLGDSRNYNSLVPIPRIVEEPGAVKGFFEKYGVYTFVYNLSGARSMEHAGTIVINISEEWVRDIIDSVDINPAIKVLIVDRNDRLLLGDAKNTMLSSANVYRYVKGALDAKKRDGSVLIDLDGEKTLLVFSYADAVSWIFVKLIPYAYIMTDVVEMRKNLLLIAASILALGALGSLLLARRLYKPIDDIFGTLLRLEEERKSDTRILRQHNLKRLLLQSGRLSEYELSSLLRDLDIGFEESDEYCLILVELDGFADFSGRYSDHEQELLRYGVLDAVSASIGSRFRNDGIETDDRRMVFIVNVKGAREDLASVMRALAEKTKSGIGDKFGISVSMAIGRRCGARRDISLLYEEVSRMMHYKYCIGYGSIIDDEIATMMCSEKSAFVYPHEREKSLVEAVNRADGEKALAAYASMVEYARPYGYNALITTRNTVAYAVNKAITGLASRGVQSQAYNFYAFFSRLEAAETIEESNRVFGELFANGLSSQEGRSSASHDYLIAEITALIKSDYKNINLGVSTFAYRYKVSAAYLGRLFRNITGKSMTDYINEVRIAKVSELLANTGLSMAEIMGCTGFTNKTQFHKIFKKYNGVTPKLFRQRAVIDRNRT